MFIFSEHTLLKSVPFAFWRQKYAGLKKVHPRRWLLYIIAGRVHPMNGSQSHRSVKSQQSVSQMDIQTHRSNPIHLGFSSLLYLSTLVGERDGEYNTHRLFFGIFYIFLVSLCNPFFKFYITFAFLNYTENSSVNFQFRICIHLNLELNLELIVTICYLDLKKTNEK